MEGEDLVERLRRDSRLFVRELGFFKKGIEGVEVTLSQGHSLLEIERSGGLTQHDLALLLNIDQSSACRHLAVMARKGWIVAEIDPHDKRRKVLRLTSAGRAALARYDADARRDVERAFLFLSRKERLLCAEGMRLYAAAWKKANELRRRGGA